MFKHILVPVDGSPTSRQAIDKALAIAGAFQSAITLMSTPACNRCMAVVCRMEWGEMWRITKSG